MMASLVKVPVPASAVLPPAPTFPPPDWNRRKPRPFGLWEVSPSLDLQEKAVRGVRSSVSCLSAGDGKLDVMQSLGFCLQFSRTRHKVDISRQRRHTHSSLPKCKLEISLPVTGPVTSRFSSIYSNL